jgi:hypothetical protein
MNILTQLLELDNLIIEHTKPPVTAILRSKLAFALEQADAHSDAVARQDETLSRQIETIERLIKENADKDKRLAEIKAKETQGYHRVWDDLKRKSYDLWHSKDLDHNF